MKKPTNLKRAAALGLTLTMALSMTSLPAFAEEAATDLAEVGGMPDGGMPDGGMPDGGMPDGGMGGGGNSGGTAAPSVDYQTLDVLGQAAGVYIKDGVVSKNSGLIATEGTITSTEISGTKITADTIGLWNKDTDENGVAGASGIVIKNTSAGGAANDTVVIGGADDVFTVNGEGYNTVITLDNQDGDLPNTLYTAEDWAIDNGDNSNCTFPGVGIAVSAKALKIQNTYVETKGYHRPALATYDTATDDTADLAAEVIVEDSVLAAWGSEGTGSSAPTFTCMYGSARPVIINASADSYFFNSKILSSDWGSYSLDQCSGVTVSVVNSFNENTVGGYGVYAIGSTNVIDLYGTTSVSGQYGAIICSSGSCNIYTLDKALSDSDLMGHYDGTLTMADALNEGGSTRMIGVNNAVTFTADMSGADVVSTLTAEDTYFSTLAADAVADDGSLITSVLDNYDWLTNFSVITGGAPYFFLNYIDGSTLCYRSVNSVLELDNCQLESKTGVIIETVLGYDTSASGIDVPDGTVYAGYDFTLSNMTVTGDILHEDYQRVMSLTLENTDVTGDIVTGTLASWNNGIEEYVDALWNSTDPAVGGNVGEIATAAGCTEEGVIDTLEKNDSYESFYGVDLTLTNGSTWTVASESSVASLTLDASSSIQAPAGKVLEIYVNVSMDNDDDGFDVTTGTQVASLTAGTYENVVIVVADQSAPSISFTDVTVNDWFYAPVMAAANAGIINGMGDGTFAPSANLTRAQAATLIVLANGIQVDKTATAPFSDTNGHWADAYIAAAVNASLMSGMGDGTFAPEANLTRAQLAALICQAKNLTSTDGSKTFPDVDASAWYASSVAKASAAGYVSGDEQGYRPADNVKRSEMAQVIYAMYLA